MQKEFQPRVMAHLKRAEGMLKKVIQMIDEDRYCIDVLQQSTAVIGFVKSANQLMLQNHLDSCFKAGMISKSPKKQKEMIDELLLVVNKM